MERKPTMTAHTSPPSGDRSSSSPIYVAQTFEPGFSEEMRLTKVPMAALRSWHSVSRTCRDYFRAARRWCLDT
jgi:hypothetical protein